MSLAKNERVEIPPHEESMLPLYYEAINENTCRIISYSGNKANLIIPESFQDHSAWYQNMTITEIGESAFEGNTTLVSIDLLDTIRIIGRRAFAGCTNLSSMS